MQNDIKLIPIEDNVDIEINIFAIILGGTNPFLNIEIGNGYRIEQIALDNCKFKNKLIMGDGNLNFQYLTSEILSPDCLVEDKKFISIVKHDILKCSFPFKNNVTYLSTCPFFYNEAETYKEQQFQYLNDFISRLMLFKEGDIGLYEIFFSFTTTLPFSNNYESTVLINDANTICLDKFNLDNSEIMNLNSFLQNHVLSFGLVKNIVDNFSYSYKLLYGAKAFELLVTVLEQLFLSKNQKCKKEVLSKRIAVFLGTDGFTIKNIYDEINEFYKYRSESTHEGEDSNITKQKLLKLREYARLSINKYLDLIDNNPKVNKNTTFKSIKDKLIEKLRSDVEAQIGLGILPPKT